MATNIFIDQDDSLLLRRSHELGLIVSPNQNTHTENNHMKKYIVSLILLVALTFSVNAQTNISTNAITAPSLSLTNAPAAENEYGSWELTLGGGGESLNGESYFGLDFSIGTNPFEKRPEVWITLAQSLYWEPTFAGSTDVSVNWSWNVLPNIFKDNLNLNTGWSGGALYDNQGSDVVWRTGPETTFQFEHFS